MDDNYKFVDFDKYCKTCKHYDLNDVDDPCFDCLDKPTNLNSHKPVYYEDKAR